MSSNKVEKVIALARKIMRGLDGEHHDDMQYALQALETQNEAYLRNVAENSGAKFCASRRRARNLRNVEGLIKVYGPEAEAYWQRGEAKHFGPVTQPPAGPAENDFSPAAEAQRAQMLDAAVAAGPVVEHKRVPGAPGYTCTCGKICMGPIRFTRHLAAMSEAKEMPAVSAPELKQMEQLAQLVGFPKERAEDPTLVANFAVKRIAALEAANAELLAALEAMLVTFYKTDSNACKLAKAAIAKAKGGK